MDSCVCIGACLGASTVSLVMNKENGQVVLTQDHNGKPAEIFRTMLKSLDQTTENILVTGRNVRESVGYQNISEARAVQRILDKTSKEKLPEAIVSFGGQSIIVYQVDEKGTIIKPLTFNKCGSGTGNFFLQQIKRLGFSKVEDAVTAALEIEAMDKPYVPASRCSVFCKSDCTHAANEQKATSAQIVAGICKMISDKIAELLAKFDAKKIWVVGGGSQITSVIEYLNRSGYDVHVPHQAKHFEAWGAYLMCVDGQIDIQKKESHLTDDPHSHFPNLAPLTAYSDLVEVKQMPRGQVQSGDKCILAVDVGSTTTKLVIVRLADMSIVADYYGYTLGKPHLATVEGLKAAQQALDVPVEIAGIIVTGSGRYLVETFLTDFGLKDSAGKLVPQVVVTNEISCHAKAAEFFNPGVKTVVEIGGQDAKYTQLTNGVAVDYAMNEACSAGTGSFLAEVVKEVFKIDNPRDIAPIAVNSEAPLKFGEQCSAFIESDISLALTDGATKSDIIAGLCYSICYNYINRVVGNRPLNGPISLQGGTAYNQAFCLAMAGVLKESKLINEGEKVVVPSDAGLMGSIGGALDLKEKIDRGDYQPISTNLTALINKQLEEGKSFNCKACDYKCKVQNFIIDGYKVPFGGFCRRWEAVRRGQDVIDSDHFDLTAVRDKMIFDVFSDFGQENEGAPRIGVLGNLFDLSLMPFFSTFLARLGFQVVVADEIDIKGVKKQGAAFCWPIERSHGLLQNLIEKEVNFFWLPHIKSVDREKSKQNTCPFVQGLPYYLKASFPEVTDNKILDPYLDFSSMEDILIELNKLAGKLGITGDRIIEAFETAWEKQSEFEMAKLEEGAKILHWLDENPDEFAIVVVGRPYNAFSNYLGSNKGITRKIASSGLHVIPMDFLPLENENDADWMYWTTGKNILKATNFVAGHKQLFPVYLTNFSCGPDGFLNFAFRDILGSKPSLTLEFDAHTANAGFDTRIEAFVDIIKGYQKSGLSNERLSDDFNPAAIEVQNGTGIYVDSDQERFEFQDSRVRLVYTDMGRYGTEGISAVTESLGIKSSPLPPADSDCMQIGRRYSSCKECLPYNLTLGSFIKYLEKRDPNERTIFFMPTAGGPCRFGMYNQFIKKAFDKQNAPNAAVMSLSSEDRYAGLGGSFMERTWISIVTSDIFDNMSQTIKTLAVDPISAQRVLDAEWEKAKRWLRKGVDWKNFLAFKKSLKKSARKLRMIPLKNSLNKTPKILITGEIYVRRAEFTTNQLIDKLSSDGFVVWKAPVSEWIKYHEILIRRGINDVAPVNFKSKARFFFESFYEKSVIDCLALSGLTDRHIDDVEYYMEAAERYINPLLLGEAILTTGSVLVEVFERFAGAIVIGPFGCMPTRVAASILNYKAKSEELVKISPNDFTLNLIKEKFSQSPILFIESDGSPLPPITLSQLEVFSMVAGNVGEEMIKNES